MVTKKSTNMNHNKIPLSCEQNTFCRDKQVVTAMRAQYTKLSLSFMRQEAPSGALGATSYEDEGAKITDLFIEDDTVISPGDTNVAYKRQPSEFPNACPSRSMILHAQAIGHRACP